MKKRVLIVTGVFPPESVTSACMNYDLALALSDKYEVTVLRSHPTRPLGVEYSKEQEKIDGAPFKIITLDSYTFPASKLIGRFRESISFGKCAANFIEEHKTGYDFIYNSGWQLFGLFFIAKAAKTAKIPYMIPIQDIYPESLLTKGKYPNFVKKVISMILSPIDRYYLKNAAKIRTISEEMAAYLSKTRSLDRSKFVVVNNWQDEQDFLEKKKKLINKNFVFAYVGSVNVHSNVKLLIEAFYKAHLPQSELKIYGGGNMKEACIKYAEELGMKNISFDFIAKTDIANVQAQADVLILALPKGNGDLCVPSKLTSYMLSERPVLASVDVDSATCRYIQNAKCGIVTEADSLDKLIEGFEQLYKMPKSQLHEMGENARFFAMKHLSKTSNLGIVVSEIEKIIN